MNNKHFSALIFLFCCLFSFSGSWSTPNPNKPTIAVLNFTVLADEPELMQWGARYADVLTTEFGKENWLSVIERNEIRRLLKEMELKLSGLSRGEQSVALGKMLGAQFLVVGRLDKAGDKINIETHLVQVSTGNVLVKEKLECGVDELLSQTSKFSSSVLRRFSKIIKTRKPEERPKTVAFLRFKNTSKFKRLNFLEEILPQMLMEDLKLIGLFVLEREHIEKILAEVQLTEFGLIEDITAQRALEADFVVSGSFEEKIESGKPLEESNLEIVVDIRDVASQTTMKRIKVAGKSRELDRLEMEAAAKIVGALDIFPSIDKAFAGTERGRLLEAAIHYAKGLQILGIKDLEEGWEELHLYSNSHLERVCQCKAALNEFQKSFYLNPRGSVELRFVIAVCYSFIGDKNKAIKGFREIIADFSESKWAGESLWASYTLCSWGNDDISVLEQLVARYPKHDRVCSAYGLMGFVRGSANYSEAIKFYLKYMETFPSKWERWGSEHLCTLSNFADCYLKLNKPQKAIKILEEALEKHHRVSFNEILHMKLEDWHTVGFLIKLGDIHSDYCKDYEKAIVEYRTAGKRSPCYDIFKKLADAHLNLERWKGAKEAYSRAIGYLNHEFEDSKRMINGYLKKACACEHLGEWREALNCYEMIADKYDVSDKIKTCYEKMGEGVRFVPSVNMQELRSVRYTKENGLAHNNITALAVDKSSVWVATNFNWHAPPGNYEHNVWSNAVINCYDKRTKSWKKYGGKDGFSIRPVTCITLDGDTVWFRTVGGKVIRYNQLNSKWRNYTTKDGLFGDMVYTIDVDNESVWFGGESGDRCDSRGWICKMNKSDKKWYAYIPPVITGVSTGPYSTPCPKIVSLKSDGDYLWAGMASHKEIFRLHKPTGKWENLTSLAYRDWAGQFTGGDYSVRTIQADDDSIWLGTESRGLRRYDKSNNNWESFYASYKASYWRPSHRRENVPANCKLPDNRIHSIAIDNDYLYVAAGGGLCAYSKRDGSWIQIKPVPYDTADIESETSFYFNIDAIITIAVDEDSIWCGTIGNGLIRYLKPHAVPANDEGRDKNGH